MTAAATERTNLLGLPRAALEEFVSQVGSSPFRARQLMQWIYKRGVSSFADMTDLAKDFRARLAQAAEVRAPQIVSAQRSGRRHLQVDACGRTPARPSRWCSFRKPERGTLCISSQVGCALDCSFCATAQQGFNRNLSTAEIVGQVWLAVRELAREASPTADAAAPGDPRRVTNVVLMGMGEPLANFRNVVPALGILLDDFGFDLSRRRVTLSTSGLVPQIYKLAQVSERRAGRVAARPRRCAAQRAGADQPQAPDRRAAQRLLALSRRAERPQRHLRVRDARWRQRFAGAGARAGASAQGSPGQGEPDSLQPVSRHALPALARRRSIQRFRDELLQRGLLATIRRTRGEDIDAACGQLAGRVIDRTTVRLGNKVIGVAVHP